MILVFGNRQTGEFYYDRTTREMKKRIAIAKEAFNRKMSLLTSKLNIELKKIG